MVAGSGGYKPKKYEPIKLGKNVKTLKPFRIQKTANEWWVTSPGIIAFELARPPAERCMRELNKVIKKHFAKTYAKVGGAYARRKGHGFERELVTLLRPYFPKARRQLEFQKDCALGTDLAETGRFRFQCKKLANYASVNTIEEVQCDRELFGEVPILVTKADGKPAMAVMHLEDFLSLLGNASKRLKSG